MNQRITVRAIIRKDDKTLLVRRRDGRPAVVGKYQLPGGRVEYKEDPKSALERYLHDTVGLTAQAVQLFDVVSYVDHENRDLQYFYVVYLVSVASDAKVRLNERYDHYIWKNPRDVSVSDLTDATQLLLNIQQSSVTDTNLPKNNNYYDAKKATTSQKVIIYSDGGSRGNPGPSAAGYVVMDAREQVIHEGGVYLGITTNNQAEYQAVRLGLEKAHTIGAREVEFRLDSLLVVNQMNGVYHIKNRELWPIHERIKALVTEFDKVRFVHVKREFNQLADGMVNKVLNAHASTV